MLAALFILVAVTLMVVVGIMFGKRAAPTGTGTPEAESTKVNPFESMTYSDDNTPKKAKDETDPEEVARILDSIEFESKLNSWEAAQDLRGQAKAKMAEFQALREEGDAAWHDAAREAKDLYEEAVQKATVYFNELKDAVGADAYPTQRVEKLLVTWRRDLIGLQKTVGR